MKNRRCIFNFVFVFWAFYLTAQNFSTELKLEPGERVWVGMIMDGSEQPFLSMRCVDFNFVGRNGGNQVQPLVLTSKGQYLWSEDPYKIEITKDKVLVSVSSYPVKKGREGNSLAEVQRYVSHQYFSASGKMPNPLLFSRPQFNTWIELSYNQNQEDILKYAHSILDNGFPPGVLMIDDTWQEDYGNWNFHPKRFPHPKKMMDELHQMGFKVILWICPFVSPDQYLICQEIKKEKGFILQKSGEKATWKEATDPYLIRWWNGVSHVLDLSNPAASKWFNNQLDKLVNDYGVDGFKFDAGDSKFYPTNSLGMKGVSAKEQTRLYAQIGLRFPLNEYRVSWKMGGQAITMRLCDKKHSWEDLQCLVPNMLLQNMMGYTFSCPDMIGGGDLGSFTDSSKIDQDLVVRSAQCHALMSMMQFSAAPWRILDKVHLEAVKKALDLRMKFTPLILSLAEESAKTGEPMMKSMEFVFPNQGYAEIQDQFMLGNEMLVAPMLEKSPTYLSVVLPKGNWLADDGKTYKGGQSYSISAPIDRLPYFTLKK